VNGYGEAHFQREPYSYFVNTAFSRDRIYSRIRKYTRYGEGERLKIM